ncbi:hypothetical protein Golax_020607 [Gossypium laxum]|uniref:DUF4283 domain-containing protein n=1 Tax=Gossypium laxum TaxID=34288 RepID=A0A7J9B4N1_9ROSI|nr:hypothetical protein [Gossypium laxum]
MANPLSGEGRDDPQASEDRNTKKVRFKEGNKDKAIDMVVDLDAVPTLSSRDKLLGKRVVGIEETNVVSGIGVNEDFDFLEGDVTRSIVNGIPNQMYSIWWSSKSFHLMDIENEYFLAKFYCIEDSVKVLSQGTWIIYGYYLTVQSWTKDFNPLQPYPSVVMAWVRLSRLLSILYKKKIFEEIGGMIGKVAKLDFNIDRRTRGRFIRMVVYVNLNKSFVSQVLVNEAIQQVEFESLMTIYFSCGRYGHVKEMCPKPVVDLN